MWVFLSSTDYPSTSLKPVSMALFCVPFAVRKVSKMFKENQFFVNRPVSLKYKNFISEPEHFA